MDGAQVKYSPSSSYSAARNLRQSSMSRISRLWRPSQEQASAADSPHGLGKTFVVPLFLSTSRSSARNNLPTRGGVGPPSARSRTSTRSVIEPFPSSFGGVQPLSVPLDARTESSDMYGSSVRDVGGHEINGHSGSLPTTQNPDYYSTTTSERSATRSGRSHSRSTHSSRRRTRKHVVPSKQSLRDLRVNAKAKISFAFGVTLLIAVGIYLALAVTGVGRNTMFHVVSILFILTLAGIFCHQLIRMFMLMRQPRRPRHRTGNKSRHGHARGHPPADPRQGTTLPVGAADELSPGKPIQIFTATDGSLEGDVEAVGSDPAIRIPPPVYGNFRTSRRMNPDFVHLKHVPPSPLTPTYDEAMSQVRGAVGYRPPSYISESGVTEVMVARTRDVDAALDNIHPLERERMRTMAAEALEGRGTAQV